MKFLSTSGLLDYDYNLESGSRVSFDVIDGEKGLKANNVQILPLVTKNLTTTDQENKTPTDLLNSSKILKSISENWKLEAKLESKKYFYHFQEVSSILDGNKYYLYSNKTGLRKILK